MNTSTSLHITDNSHIGEARRIAQGIASQLNFAETVSGQLSIITTELAGNLLKHAGQGEIIFRKLHTKADVGIELLALDTGKGMTDVAQCLEDGYSTAGSPGTGLGAVQRLATVFDIYSRPEKGTAILAQLFSGPEDPIKENGFVVGAVCLPIQGEKESGDGWSVRQSNDNFQVLVVDGLGHGPLAAEAANQAKEMFDKELGYSPVQLMQAIHKSLRNTRGAAGAITQLDTATNNVRFAGIGNIAGFIFGGDKERGLASYNGTLGHQLAKVQEINVPWPGNGILILHSDGLGTKWKLEDYPALRQRHPALIAGILYRDFQRNRDDVTVVVIKEEA